MIAGLIAVAAVLGCLGCSGDDSTASSVESPSVTKPVVTKEYYEDPGDPNGEEYRYWDYTFDFGEREYLARVYIDEPEVGYVDRIDEAAVDDDSFDVGGVDVDLTGDVGAVQRHDPVERVNLGTILRHLNQDGWPKLVIHTMVGDMGYKPLPLG